MFIVKYPLSTDFLKNSGQCDSGVEITQPLPELSRFSAHKYGRQHKAPCAAEQAGLRRKHDFQPVKRATVQGLVTAVARFTGLRRVGPSYPAFRCAPHGALCCRPPSRAKNGHF